MEEPTQNAPIDLLQILKPADIHQDVEIREQTLHHMADPGLAHDAQAPDPQPADPDELRTQGERLEDVTATADTAVVHDIRLLPDGSDDILQRVEACDRAIDLPAGVVADDEAVDAQGDGILGVGDALDAFQAEGLALADALP